MQYGIGAGVPGWLPFVLPLIVPLVVWSLIWKGLALWHASRRGEAVWFIVLLVVNTLGILEIIYLFFFAKLKMDQLFTKGPRQTE